ncbi:MAG TPA: glycoside hydrolase family 76 protein [Solirubrobacteraceae bacterium]|nr:glycoside hydrolase family 76 protein [Solirubrobacteraceae bacterium]
MLGSIPARSLGPIGVVAIAIAVLICAGAPAGAIARASHKGSSASPYPAAAQNPPRPVRPSEYAHTSSNGVGGVSSGSSTPASAPSGKAPSKTSKTSKAPATKKKPKPGLHGNPARALLAFQAMQQNFYIPGTGLYEGEPYSYLWPFSQALAATVSVANIPGQAASAASTDSHELKARIVGLQKYWGEPTPVAGQGTGEQPESEEHGEGSEPTEAAGIAPPALPSFNGEVVPPGGASYYDDNEWVGIELARLYKLHHEAAMLEKAEQIMAFVMAGWQSSPKLACPGGVPFSDSPSNTERNTVTDGPAAELGVQLYRLTGDATYLQFAEQAYEWVRDCLRSPSELYYDHIRLHGVLDTTLWSYNQGSMIGAGVLLYQATGNGAYLYQARQTAKAALAYFTISRMLSENPFFPSVYFRNLMYLDSVTHDPPGSRLAQEYVNSVWVHQRLSDNLFAFGSPPSTQLLDQAAVVQIYALLSTPPSTYF